MSLQKLQHIPLKSAYLCQDCNAVGNSSKQCPACASEVLLSLAVVLNREEGIACLYCAAGGDCRHRLALINRTFAVVHRVSLRDTFDWEHTGDGDLRQDASQSRTEAHGEYGATPGRD